MIVTQREVDDDVFLNDVHVCVCILNVVCRDKVYMNLLLRGYFHDDPE